MGSSSLSELPTLLSRSFRQFVCLGGSCGDPVPICVEPPRNSSPLGLTLLKPSYAPITSGPCAQLGGEKLLGGGVLAQGPGGKKGGQPTNGVPSTTDLDSKNSFMMSTPEQRLLWLQE